MSKMQILGERDKITGHLPNKLPVLMQKQILIGHCPFTGKTLFFEMRVLTLLKREKGSIANILRVIESSPGRDSPSK